VRGENQREESLIAVVCVCSSSSLQEAELEKGCIGKIQSERYRTVIWFYL